VAELSRARAPASSLVHDYARTLVALGTALREREGLKQIELATAAGMTESQISDIERGKNNPGWLLVAI
jgi:hypothetical protein